MYQILDIFDDSNKRYVGAYTHIAHTQVRKEKYEKNFQQKTKDKETQPEEFRFFRIH